MPCLTANGPSYLRGSSSLWLPVPDGRRCSPAQPALGTPQVGFLHKTQRHPSQGKGQAANGWPQGPIHSRLLSVLRERATAQCQSRRGQVQPPASPGKPSPMEEDSKEMLSRLTRPVFLNPNYTNDWQNIKLLYCGPVKF